MYSVWLSDDEQRVWRNYLAVSAALEAAMNRQLQCDSGLSLADYDVLVALGEQAPCRVNELANRLGWEQSRLSHHLRRMRQRGLVERNGADGDRRGTTATLTPAGRDALRQAAPGHAALVRATAFDGVPAAQLTALDRWTSTILRRLLREEDPSA